MRVFIRYANESTSTHEFKLYSEAMNFARDGISYSGGKVRKVELDTGDSVRTLWNSEWNTESKIAGLKNAS